MVAGGLLALASLSACRRGSSPVAWSPVVARTQAGVDRPDPPQAFLGLAVYDVPGDVRPLLARLTDVVRTATADLTVTVGLGPRLVAAVDPALPGARDLPAFDREEITTPARGGDLMVQVCAGDPVDVTATTTLVAREVGAAPRWSQRGFRQAGQRIGRNVLGFLDGIEVPRGAAVDREVWLSAPAAVAGGTVAVVRRLRVDLAAFLAQPLDRQEAVVGRRRADGAPLTGGGLTDHVDLAARTPDGRYVVPVNAHVRRANPAATGSGAMLRRGYSYDNGPGDAGLLFISYQRDLRTFTATQHRLDEADDLMAFTTATASATFLVLPGPAPGEPLGHRLFG